MLGLYFSMGTTSMTSSKTLAKRFSLQMWHQILIAMLLGLAVGHFFGEPAKMLQPLGDVFMSLIRMCVVPVVFVSVVCGITSLPRHVQFDSKRSELGRLERRPEPLANNAR